MMTRRKWFIAILLVLVAIVAGIIIFASSSKQSERNHRIEQEILGLEREAEKIRRENETLKEKIAYFASDDFREQEAKKKLGLKRSDETMVVIRSGEVYDRNKPLSAHRQQEDANDTDDPGLMGHIVGWWHAFFRADVDAKIK